MTTIENPTPEQLRIIREARAEFKRTAELPELKGEAAKNWRRKTETPLGLLPDGTVNVASD